MAKKKPVRKPKPKPPLPCPSKPGEWSWKKDTRDLVKFTFTTTVGFIAGFGGLFATSDNASRLIENNGWYAALGLTVLTIVRWAQLFMKDNSPEGTSSSGTHP